MKFGEKDLGVFIAGATLYNSTEQGYHIARFAHANGLEFDLEVLEEAIKKTDEWSYDEHEEFGYLVDDSVDYLNTFCAEDGYYFTFENTDFVLVKLDDESV